MGTSTESILTLKAGTIPSLWEDGEENQLAGAAQAVPAFPLSPTVSCSQALSCRLPRPHRVPACPVWVVLRKPYHVKTAQEAARGGGGALVLALT